MAPFWLELAAVRGTGPKFHYRPLFGHLRPPGGQNRPLLGFGGHFGLPACPQPIVSIVPCWLINFVIPLVLGGCYVINGSSPNSQCVAETRHAPYVLFKLVKPTEAYMPKKEVYRSIKMCAFLSNNGNGTSYSWHHWGRHGSVRAGCQMSCLQRRNRCLVCGHKSLGSSSPWAWLGLRWLGGLFGGQKLIKP